MDYSRAANKIFLIMNLQKRINSYSNISRLLPKLPELILKFKFFMQFFFAKIGNPRAGGGPTTNIIVNDYDACF